MAEYYDDDDNLDEQPQDGKSLRRKLESTLKKLQEVESKLQGYQQKEAVTDASKLMSEKGYAPDAARFAQKDGIDLSDPRQLDTWLEENGRFFKADAVQQESSDSPKSEQSNTDPLFAQNLGALQRSQQFASPATVSKLEHVLKNLKEDATSSEVAAAFKEAGVLPSHINR